MLSRPSAGTMAHGGVILTELDFWPSAAVAVRVDAVSMGGGRWRPAETPCWERWVSDSSLEG